MAVGHVGRLRSQPQHRRQQVESGVERFGRQASVHRNAAAARVSVYRDDRVHRGGKPELPSSATARRLSRSTVVWGAVLVAVAASLSATWIARRTAAATTPVFRSIAVLPLDNLSPDPNDAYLADGITDELTTDLAKISSLRVISRGSVLQFRGGRVPSPEIGRRLNVEAIVEGSVTRTGDRVRVTAQPIDAAADRHLWAESYERNVSDLLALQRDVAAAIADRIQAKINDRERAGLTSSRRVNPEAYIATKPMPRSCARESSIPCRCLREDAEASVSARRRSATPQREGGRSAVASSARAANTLGTIGHGSDSVATQESFTPRTRASARSWPASVRPRVRTRQSVNASASAPRPAPFRR